MREQFSRSERRDLGLCPPGGHSSDARQIGQYQFASWRFAIAGRFPLAALAKHPGTVSNLAEKQRPTRGLGRGHRAGAPGPIDDRTAVVGQFEIPTAAFPD